MALVNKEKLVRFIEMAPSFLAHQTEQGGTKDITFDRGFFLATEGYKKRLYSEYRSKLGFDSWSFEMIGKGVIA